MSSKIILKKSSVAAKAPVAADLAFGELAINYTDSKLYFKKADGSIDAFTSAAASAPVTSVGGNIGDITDAQLLASIKNVDGAGSGLDADTLDGLNSSSFYLASNPSGYTSNTGTVTSVGATSPVVSSGGTTPTISIPAATASVDGFMTAAYASKLDGIAAGATANTGTVTSVGGTGGYGGLTLSGTVTTSGNLTLGGTPTGSWPISVTGSSASTTGNAATATTLQTARTINGVSFNGSADITISAPDNTKLPLAGGTMTGQLTGITSGASTTASFFAGTTGGSYASVYTRRGVPFTVFGADSGSSYKPAFNMIYSHNSGWDGVYSIGVLNESAANPGAFNIMHINSGGGQQYVWNFQGHTGNFTSPGNVTANSDERLKKDWQKLPSDFIYNLSKVKTGTYTRTDSDERQAGSSAQDWQKLLPEVVQTANDEDKTLSLAYGNAALVSAVELAKKVVEQEERIKKLEELISKLIAD